MAVFAAGETNEVSLTSPGAAAFLAKYDGTGALLWARAATGTSPQNAGRSVAVGAAGNSHGTGFFHETVTFGSESPARSFCTASGTPTFPGQEAATFGLGELRDTLLTSAGATDIFVATTGSDVLCLEGDDGTQLVQNFAFVVLDDGDDVVNFAHPSIVLGKGFIDGGRGDDILWGNAGNDHIRGFNGNDFVHAVSRNRDSSHNSRAGHPGSLRCSTLKKH